MYSSIVDGQEDVTVTWRHEGWTVKTFEVYFSATSDGDFERVNAADTLTYGYTHQLASLADGFYKVRAVDYWDRVGPFSDTVGLDGSVIPAPDDPGGGAGGEGGTTASGGAAGNAGAANGGAGTSAGGSGAGTSGAAGASGGTPGSGGVSSAEPNSEDSGCGACATHQAHSPWGALGAFAVALSVGIRRRRSRRRARPGHGE
jgi:MYXO-CTERM domain-containing protein